MKQPEALRLAGELKKAAGLDTQWDAATELIRLHKANQAMLEELENCVDLIDTCFPLTPIDSCIGQAITKARAAIAKGEQP